MIALVALVVAAVYWVGRGRESARPLPLPDAASHDGAHDLTHDGAHVHDAPLESPGAAARASTPNAGPATPSLPRNDDRFAGRGRIRGELVSHTGAPVPANWTLVLEPHPTWVGNERATRQRVDCRQPTFDVADLPLGAYRVRAEAEGLNGDEVGVLLVKGSAMVDVTLAVRPAGLIDGQVLAPDGAAGEDLVIVLESKETKLRRTAVVDGSGLFVFRDVIDGDYVLTYGPPEAPLLPPKDVRFVAPTLRMPPATLPATGALRVRTVDDRGNPQADVDVDGFGAPKGTLRVRTGFDGKAIARWLFPGTYRLEARTNDGRRGKVSIDVRVGAEIEAVIYVRD